MNYLMNREVLKRVIIFFMALCMIFFMARWAYSADVTLAWDANTESNLAGYKLHFNTEKAGPPYTTTVDVGNVLEYTFADIDLQSKHYWFVATAYSVEGFESDFSNEVTTKPPGAPTGVRVKVTVVIEVQ